MYLHLLAEAYGIVAGFFSVDQWTVTCAGDMSWTLIKTRQFAMGYNSLKGNLTKEAIRKAVYLDKKVS